MGQNGRIPRTGLTADEFCARFQTDARVLWTLAAGLLGDPTEAEDVCQEAFLAAYAKCDQFEPGTDFLAWMGRFVRNVSANELRKRARRRTASTDPVLLDQDAGGSPTEAAVRLGSQAFDERLLAGLDELGGPARVLPPALPAGALPRGDRGPPVDTRGHRHEPLPPRARVPARQARPRLPRSPAMTEPHVPDALDRRIEEALRHRFTPPVSLDTLAERARPRGGLLLAPWLAVVAAAAAAVVLILAGRARTPSSRTPAARTAPRVAQLASAATAANLF